MISNKKLKTLLRYNRRSGIFTWRKTIGSMAAGKVAGHIRSDGYVGIAIEHKIHKAHRLAWLYVKGEFPKERLDHKNGNPTDNKFSNLREASSAQNKMNSRAQKRNRSGFKGVALEKHCKGKWSVRISCGGIKKRKGLYDCPVEAAHAYDRAAIELFGSFARLNFPKRGIPDARVEP